MRKAAGGLAARISISPCAVDTTAPRTTPSSRIKRTAGAESSSWTPSFSADFASRATSATPLTNCIARP